MHNSGGLLTLIEAAKLLRMSKSKLNGERKAGRLRVLQFGRCVRVDPRDLNRYLAVARKASRKAPRIIEARSWLVEKRTRPT